MWVYIYLHSTQPDCSQYIHRIYLVYRKYSIGTVPTESKRSELERVSLKDSYLKTSQILQSSPVEGKARPTSTAQCPHQVNLATRVHYDICCLWRLIVCGGTLWLRHYDALHWQYIVMVRYHCPQHTSKQGIISCQFHVTLPGSLVDDK